MKLPPVVHGKIFDTHRVRAEASEASADGAVAACRGSEWRDIITWPQEETGSPIAFTQDGQSLYVQARTSVM